MKSIPNLTVAEAKALRLLERKHGADVQILCTRLTVEERQARSIIDRLRRKGVEIQHVGKSKFQVGQRHSAFERRTQDRRMAQAS